MGDGLAGWFTALRGMPRGVWLIVFGALLGRGAGFVVPFLTLFMTGQRGVEPVLAGLVVAAYGGGGVVGSVVGGILADRIGRKPVMLLSLFSAALVTPVIPQLSSPMAIAGALAVLGFVVDMYRPASGAAIGDMTGDAQRVRAYGLIYWAANLGSAIAPVLGGFLAASGRFEALFWANAAVVGAWAVFMAVGFREPDRHRIAASAGEPLPRARSVWLDPVVWAVSGGSLLCSLLFFQAYTTLPLAMRDAGLDTADYGIAVAMNGLTVVALSLPISAFIARFQPRDVLVVGGLLMGIGMAMTGLAESLVGFAVMVVVWSIGEILTAPVAPAMLAAVAPADRRGAYQSTVNAAWSLSSLAGPILGGAALQLGAPVLWIGCGVVGLMAGAVFATAPRVRSATVPAA